MSRKIALILLCILLLSTGCTSGKDNPPPTGQFNKLGPQKIVEAYYKNLAAGDYDTAKKYLSEDIDKSVYTSEDSDFKNLHALYNLQVSKETPIQLTRKNYKEVQVVAQYHAAFKKVITSENGVQVKYLYVAQKTKDAPWKIISIGTGP